MTTKTIIPCLWFDDEAEAAALFYTHTFAEARINSTSRYPESDDNPSGKPRGSILTVEFEIAGQRFTALNGGPQFVINPSISFFVHVDSAVEVERLFARLSDGGEVLMPIGSYPWSERYAWVKDRFGVSWQLITVQHEQGHARVVPCLMFTGAQHGKAEEAMHLYMRVFNAGRILGLERYMAEEGPDGTLKHGRFLVAAQEMIAMDSHIEHGFTFNEGVSLQVLCQDQNELDQYWGALCEGGEPGPCGWLKDRYGVSWQIVPTDIADWMSSPDIAARDRAFKAMLSMGKLDIAALQAAFHGIEKVA